MKINSMFHALSFLMAMPIFSMPFVTFAQQNPIEAEARAQAIADAENDANKTVWFMRGCLLNILGVAMARTTKAPVPAGRLVGKSPAYVAAYTSAYQAKRTEIQTAAAWGGATTCVVACLVGVFLFSNAADSGGGGSSWCGFFY